MRKSLILSMLSVFAITAVLVIAAPTSEAYALPIKQKTIGVLKAQTIALKHAGVKKENSIFSEKKFDLDDGTPEYELEFYSGGKKYEYDIHAVKGTIMSYSQEVNSKNYVNTKKGSESSRAVANSKNVGIEKAKEIARKHAGVSKDGMDFIHGKLDHDDGVPVYELKFQKGTTEYEYEIHAITGVVREFDSESIYD